MASKALALLALTLLLALWPQDQVWAQDSLRVGVLADRSEGSFPFAYEDDSQSLVGYEIALMERLCVLANATCEWVELGNLEDRIALLVNGSIDATIGQLSFTPGRAAVVDFVRPFYYSSGVALFSPKPTGGSALSTAPTGPAASSGAGWETLTGQRVCFVQGYYAIAFIAQNYDVKIQTYPDLRSASDATRAGSCVALAYDSVAPESEVGLPLLAGIQPAYASPYGIAVQRGDQELNDRLTVALVRAMSSGDASEVLQYEREYLVANDVGPSKSLAALVSSISDFDAPTTGPRETAPTAGNNNFLGGQLAG